MTLQAWTDPYGSRSWGC